MTTYSIVKAINNSVNNAFLGQERYYVVFADGERSGTRENIVGYATDESAKRRIRDLKRKETTNDTLVEAKIEQIKAVNVTPATHEFVETPDKCESLPDLREIATGKIISALTVPTPNVDKLAASSAYGKFETPPWFGKDALVRQRGCYPHVSKRAYQR